MSRAPARAVYENDNCTLERESRRLTLREEILFLFSFFFLLRLVTFTDVVAVFPLLLKKTFHRGENVQFF